MTRVLSACLLLLLAACRQETPATLFRALPAETSGIHFANTINEAAFTKGALNEFAYMGAGLGVLDVNNDGLKDLFFAGNQVSSKLYLNKGHLQFEDVTETFRLATDRWCTGVSVADVNGDGWDDIYVCNYGRGLTEKAANQLFINQGGKSFTEEAAAWGIADTSYSTQALFVDYDNDGDLDLYLANYRFDGTSANSIFPKDQSGHSPAQDKLYRNDGVANGAAHPTFTDVTLAAGIIEDGYGLGVSASDFNGDGYPDIFVANDFLGNDNLWINTRDGRFNNRLSTATRHQSYSSMGCDAADINNDGRIDFMSLDMMPETNERQKLTFSFMNYDRYQAERQLGYSPSFMRNMLQLNQGNDSCASPYFSEIGQLAGMAETDWSWSVLLADFDNDGWKDAHMTNGIGRDFINADFIQYSKTVGDLTGDPVKQRQLLNEKLVSIDPVLLPNYLYRNKGRLQFEDISAKAGIDKKSLSTGAAYADLDNDGDLDLVTNNINAEAFVWINQRREQSPATSHYIGVAFFEGSRGLGAKVTIYFGGLTQVQEQYPVRGYCSSVDSKLLFGIGTETRLDSLRVEWPGGFTKTYASLAADSVYVISRKDAVQQPLGSPVTTDSLLLPVRGSLVYQHHDVAFNDFAVQRLLPQKFSQLGPFLSTADVNGDGLEDLFVGGGFNSAGMLFRQQPGNRFAATALQSLPRLQEDAVSHFFDADGDGDADLLLTHGDYRYPDGSPHYRPLLYRNDGKGGFIPDSTAIPAGVSTIGGAIATADVDGDGDLDVFIGGRVSRRFPLSPPSYLLRNDGGKFTDITSSVCPALVQAGMITGAVWTDFNGDKKPDLVIAGEWMPLRFFENRSGLLQETFPLPATAITGSWRCLLLADVDGDGDDDLVAGNLGWNNRFKVSEKYPLSWYAKDLDNNGSIDPLLFYYVRTQDSTRELRPGINRDLFAEQVPGVKKKFLSHQKYAMASFNDILPDTSKLLQLHCSETASCWFENLGGGRFAKHQLPVEAQLAPVNTLVCGDINGDGRPDLVLAGNEYQAEVMGGLYDASYGQVLLGQSDKNFRPVQTGLRLEGDIKSMTWLNTAGGRWLVAAANDGPLQVFRVQ